MKCKEQVYSHYITLQGTPRAALGRDKEGIGTKDLQTCCFYLCCRDLCRCSSLMYFDLPLFYRCPTSPTHRARQCSL